MKSQGCRGEKYSYYVMYGPYYELIMPYFDLIRKIEKFCDVDVQAFRKEEQRFWTGYQKALDDVFDIIYRFEQLKDETDSKFRARVEYQEHRAQHFPAKQTS